MTKNQLRHWRMKSAELDIEHEADRMAHLGIKVTRSSSPRRSRGRHQVHAYFPGSSAAMGIMASWRAGKALEIL